MMIVMQGRVLSTRLPAKGFFTFFGQTVWERMCDIALAVRGAEEVVFATGDTPENELIRPYVERKGIRFFVGSEKDVLGRFVAAASGYAGKYLVRITCDNYLIQPEVIEELVGRVEGEGTEYGYVAPLSHYAGEVIACSALRGLHAGPYSELSREHVTWDLRENPAISKTVLPPDFQGLNHAESVTLDSIGDFVKMKRLEWSSPRLACVRCLPEVRRLFPAPVS